MNTGDLSRFVLASIFSDARALAVLTIDVYSCRYVVFVE